MDSHNLLVQLNVELLAGPLCERVPPVSVAVTVPVSISVAVSATLTASISIPLVVSIVSISLGVSVSLPTPFLVSTAFASTIVVAPACAACRVVEIWHLVVIT